MTKYTHEWYLKNKESLRRARKKWREKNKEKITDYLNKNRQRINERRKVYYQNNKFKFKIWQFQYLERKDKKE